MLKPESRMDVVRQNEAVVSDRVDGNMVLCNSDTGEFYKINQMGDEIWRSCDGRSIDQVITVFLTTHPNSEQSRAEKIVYDYIEALAHNDLVTIEGSIQASQTEQSDGSTNP
jgi:hypothetical protein